MLVPRYNDVLFCLHKRCRSYTKNKCFVKIRSRKKDVRVFVQNVVGRNGLSDGLSVPSTIFYEKLTKLVQLNEKGATEAPRMSEHNKISRVFLSSYAAKRTILAPAEVLTNSRKLSGYLAARRRSCTSEESQNAAKRYCDDDVC